MQHEGFSRFGSLFIPWWWPTAMKAWQMWLAVPQVIVIRTARLASAGVFPGAHDRKEFALMGQEKLAAFSESASAMTTQLYRMNQEMALNGIRQWWNIWTRPWLAFSPVTRKPTVPSPLLPSPASLARVVDKGLAPIQKRATRNAKRLGKLGRT